MLPPAGQPTPPSSRATAGGVPPALANLPAGVAVTGVVTGRDAAGHVLVRTNAGNLSLASDLDLARGSTVTLRVRGGPGFAATIESVNGRPTQGARVVSAPPLPHQPAPAASQPASATSVTTDSLLTAVVVASQPGSGLALRPLRRAGDSARLTPLPPGTRIVFRLVPGNLAAPVAGPPDSIAPAVTAPPATVGVVRAPPGAPLAPPPATPPEAPAREALRDAFVSRASALVRQSAVHAGPPNAPGAAPMKTTLEGSPSARSPPSAPSPGGRSPVSPLPGVGAPVAGGPAVAHSNPPITRTSTSSAATNRNGADPLPAARGGGSPPSAPSGGPATGAPEEGVGAARGAPGATPTAAALEASPSASPRPPSPGKQSPVNTPPGIGAAVNTDLAAPLSKPAIPGLPAAPASSSAIAHRDGPGAYSAAPGSGSPTLASRAPAGPASAAAEGSHVTAVVVGSDGAGRPLLSTPLGTIQLESWAPLAVGETVTLAVVVQRAPAQSPAGSDNAPFGITRGWPALREVIDVLRNVDPRLAEAMVARALPSPGKSLASTTLFFLAALRAGDLDGWLGRAAVRVLEDRNLGGLVRRLSAEFAQVARFAEQPAGGDWQPYFIPLHDGAELRQLRLFVRRQGRDDDEQDDAGTRFIVEVELSRFGELQLDGFIQERRFDLILRSRAPMPESSRRDIAAIFADGLAVGGLAGTLGFQATKTFPVSPLDDVVTGRLGGVLV